MAFSMRIAYFDCFSGVSGDMCLGALVDSGLPLADLVQGLEVLRLRGFSLRSRRVARGALSGTKVDVLIEKGRDQMLSLRDVRRVLKAAHLPEPVRDRSLAVFDRLAEAEGLAHRTPAAQPPCGSSSATRWSRRSPIASPCWRPTSTT